MSSQPQGQEAFLGPGYSLASFTDSQPRGGGFPERAAGSNPEIGKPQRNREFLEPCSGLNHAPLQDSGPLNVIVFGDRLFKEVIKLKSGH